MESESLATPPPARAQTCARCGFAFAARVCPRCAFSALLDASGSSTAGSSFPNLPDAKWAPPLAFQQYRLDIDADGAPVELGRGGMGVTFKAFDTQLEIPVVLKFISPLLFGGPAVEQRFLREARVAARLRHHHVAAVLNLGQHEGCWFYAMEFVPGRTLAQLVDDDGPLTSEEAREVGRQTALALAEAGRLQLVHRDIKPSNLMVERRPDGLRVKIIDFGLVKTLDALDDPRLTDSGLLGTPHFASPEQLREGSVDQRADFYALGGTLWFALTGRTLARGSRAEVMAHHLKPPGGHVLAEEPRANSLPEGWDGILHALLSFDPAARPADAVGVLALLDGRTFSPIARSRKRVLRWPMALFSMASVSVLAFALPKIWKPSVPLDNKFTSTDPAALVTEARDFMDGLRPDGNHFAILLLQRAVSLDPTNAEARSLLIQAYTRSVLRFGGDRQYLAVAMEEAERLIKSAPDSPAALIGLAHARYANGHYRSARQAAERALELGAASSELLRLLAACAREMGQLRVALDYAQRSVRHEPVEALAWSILANIQKKLEMDDDAIATYERAALNAPRSPEPILGIAHVQYLAGRFQEGLATMERTRNLKGDVGDILCLQAQFAIQTGNFADAETMLREAQAKRPGGNPLYFGQIRYLSLLGWLLQRRGQADDARLLLEQAIALDERDLAGASENDSYRYSMAVSLLLLGRVEEGKAVWRDALRYGWDNQRAAARDPRLQAFLGDPEVQELLRPPAERR